MHLAVILLGVFILWGWETVIVFSEGILLEYDEVKTNRLQAMFLWYLIEI